jgi:NAD(P)-dependent dehydrogenase (short-subunit alcohol dehydrogenase family)
VGRLDGEVAVITGGSSGMALAGAKLFVDEGAHVFISGRRQEALDDAVARRETSPAGAHDGLGQVRQVRRRLHPCCACGATDSMSISAFLATYFSAYAARLKAIGLRFA